MISGPEDDIIVFALSCSLNDIPMYVCNQKDYGMIMLPLEDNQKLEDDLEILRHSSYLIFIRFYVIPLLFF